MLKAIFLSILSFVLISVEAQVQTRVIGDSVFVQNNSGKSELIIRNSTDSINGFLFNKGAGRTEFRRVLIKVNDSTYLIGADSLHLNNTGGSGWSLTGNAGTIPDTNFIGTKDNQPLFFKVNNGLSGMIGTSSTYNTSLGVLTTSTASTGKRNTAIGAAALGLNKSGYNNSAIGYGALYHNTTGHDNVALGWSAIGWDSSSIGNTAIGSQAMNQVYSVINNGGSFNTAIGMGALGDNWNNKYNIGIGKNAGVGSTSSNTFYISDSTYHFRFKLDSAGGMPPSVIGKDANGYWHVYRTPEGEGQGSYNLPIAAATTLGGIKVGGGLSIDSSGKLSAITSLFKKGSVPYADTDGSLIQDTLGFFYTKNSLTVGQGGFYNTSKIAVNGGNGVFSASGNGVQITASGGFPADPSKSIWFYNSGRPWLRMWMPDTGVPNAAITPLEGMAYMHWYPAISDSFNLGKPTNQWKNAYVKNLYIDGTYYDPTIGGGGGSLSIASAETLGGIKVGEGLVIDGTGVLRTNGWNLTGNNGIDPDNNFIGTKDFKSLVFKVNNVQSGLIGEYVGNVVKANTAFGYGSLQYVSSIGNQGYGNSGVGSGSINTLTTGSWSTAIGYHALGSITYENNNSALGAKAAMSMTGMTNTTSLGANSTPTQSNQVILGDTNVTQVLTHGNVLSKVAVKSSDPTTAEIPDGFTAVYKNSATGNTYLWANIGGALIKVQLQ